MNFNPCMLVDSHQPVIVNSTGYKWHNCNDLGGHIGWDCGLNEHEYLNRDACWLRIAHLSKLVPLILRTRQSWFVLTIRRTRISIEDTFIAPWDLLFKPSSKLASCRLLPPLAIRILQATCCYAIWITFSFVTVAAAYLLTEPRANAVQMRLCGQYGRMMVSAIDSYNEISGKSFISQKCDESTHEHDMF